MNNMLIDILVANYIDAFRCSDGGYVHRFRGWMIHDKMTPEDHQFAFDKACIIWRNKKHAKRINKSS